MGIRAATVAGLACLLMVSPSAISLAQASETAGAGPQVQPKVGVQASADHRATRATGCTEAQMLARQRKLSKTTLCIESAKPTGMTAKQVLEKVRGTVTPAAIQQLPDFCGTIPGNNGLWYALINDRTKMCNIQIYDLRVMLPSGFVIGLIEYAEVNYSYTFNNSITWFQQTQLGVLSAQGDVSGITVSGLSADCVGPCAPGTLNFPTQPVLTGVASGEAPFRSIITGGTGSSNTSLSYQFFKPNTRPSPIARPTPPVVRCDLVLPGNINPGCVFSQLRPVLIYSLGDPFRNQLANHIRQAQASGLPGAYPNGAPLTRADSGIQQANRLISCPLQANGGPPRPVGFECDEYPFASTLQGAAVQQTSGGRPRTFNGCSISSQFATIGDAGTPGWSICMISADQNGRGGSDAGAFYLQNRVIPGDPFYVQIQ